ncbi:hypothetical protein BH18THE2_BH18THE2_11680 [soil metagenome]
MYNRVNCLHSVLDQTYYYVIFHPPMVPCNPMLWRILQKETCPSVIEFITNYSNRSRQLLVTSELTYRIENNHRLGDNKQARNQSPNI